MDWQWIGGGKVEGVGGRVAVGVRWGSYEWQWQSGGGGSGGEGGGKINLSAVVVVRGVELRWIGVGAVGGLVVDWWW